MMPASMRGASSRCRSSSRMARAARHSSSVAIIGNMTAMLPSPGRAKYRAQLRAEQLGTIQQHADAALAEKRIVLARKRQVRQRLVAADVERPHDQPAPAPERARDVAVNGPLLLLGRSCRPMKEQKLRSQQADGLGTESDALLRIGQPADVRRHFDAVTVERRRRLEGVLLLIDGARATDSPGAGGCGRCQRSTGSGAACPWSRRGSPASRWRGRAPGGRSRPRAESRAIARVSRRATKCRPSSCTARAPGRDSTRLCRKASAPQPPGSCLPRK